MKNPAVTKPKSVSNGSENILNWIEVKQKQAAFGWPFL